MSYRTNKVGLQIHRRKVAAAALASVLSFCAHLAFVISFASLSSRLPFFRKPIQKSIERQTMVLHSVEFTSSATARRSERLSFVNKDMASALADAIAGRPVEPPRAPLEPSPSAETRAVTETLNVAEPEFPLARTAWEPRQEILMIDRRVVRDDVAAIHRKLLPRVERVRNAPDVVPPAALDAMVAATKDSPTNGTRRSLLEDTAPAVIGNAPPVGIESGLSEILTDDGLAYDPTDLFNEEPEQVTSYQPLEKLLAARMYIYATPRDSEYDYFKIEIARLDASVLPVLPKDIVFLQDCSASMAETRLFFCRRGMQIGLAVIGPEDRFNLVRFTDKAEFCFPDWVGKSEETLSQAERFIEGMVAGGETDILAAIRTLQSLETEPGRPVIALLATDGRATTGITAASVIIDKFSRLNEGKVSVFTMGTSQTADSYLLDLLSYCNRGDTRIVRRGRWEIPDLLTGLVQEVSRPVLSDVQFRFPEDTASEVYPVQTMNLFSDRPLVLHGRCKKGTPRVIFQSTGRAGNARCDMIFDMPTGAAKRSRDKTLRTEWARQKVYHLLGEYARGGGQEVLSEISQTAKAHRIRIPHRGQF